MVKTTLEMLISPMTFSEWQDSSALNYANIVSLHELEPNLVRTL